MNRDFASSLIQLNNTFYREHSASFSDTRQAPWPGWVRTMDIALGQLDVATIEHPVRVFDLACGNMRFENFAAGGALAAKGVDGANPSADASCPFEFYGVDSCQDLAIDARGHALRIPNLHFQELDVLDALMKLTPPFEGYDSAQFEAGDHLIGWQNDRHAYRYCHHFDDQQITDLVRGVRTFYKSGEVPVRELERFHADGRSGELNRYVILKRL